MTADGESSSRLEDAAKAGWLYYIAGKTQDDIARMLNVSRPTAQRFVSICRAEGLITFRMEHPIAACMELAARLIERFDLVHCDVVPADGTPETSAVGVAEATAVYIERVLRSRQALVMALGTGRAVRASVERVSPIACPTHRLVSLVGCISPDGSATPFDGAVKLADIIKTPYYPIPLPMHVSSPEERRLLLQIDAVRKVFALAAKADVWIAGVSQISPEALLYRDGFISRDDVYELIRLGAVGEVVGWAFNADGRIIEGGTNLRITSVPPQPGYDRPSLCIAYGPAKVEPIRAALNGRIFNGLVTDDITAQALLAD